LRHVISALVKNEVGVLAHIAGLFSARAYNIDSLNVGETEDPDVSRMTIVVRGDDAVIEQVIKQLRKLINVVKVIDFSGRQYVERDLMLIKVTTPPGQRGEVNDLVEIFRGKVVDISQRDLVIELSGPEAKINAFISLCQPYGIKEVVRSGRIAMPRGTKEE
jgi:acetolactate synthase-1/3 small subunit